MLTFSRRASYVCDTGYPTTGVASGDTTLTSSCQENSTFIYPKSFEAVSCVVPEKDHRNLAPNDEVFFTAPAIVTRQQVYTMRSGDDRGAVSYSLACTAAASSSCTLEGRDLVEPPPTHDSVSGGQPHSGNSCCTCRELWEDVFVPRRRSELTGRWKSEERQHLPLLCNFLRHASRPPDHVRPGRCGEDERDLLHSDRVALRLYAGHDRAGRR